MPACTDLTGKSFGLWVVVSRAENARYGCTAWLCRCTGCGLERVVARSHLVQRESQSCGACGRRKYTPNEQCVVPSCMKPAREHYDVCNHHVATRTPEAYLVNAAKHRAKKKGLPFDITLADISIPDRCPILGIPIQKNRRPEGAKAGGAGDSSPSLDQIVPGAGYTKGNVQVISWRANRLKSNVGWQELQKIADYLRQLEHQKNVA